MAKPIQLAVTSYRQDDLVLEQLVVLLDDGRIFERRSEDPNESYIDWREVRGPWTSESQPAQRRESSKHQSDFVQAL